MMRLHVWMLEYMQYSYIAVNGLWVRRQKIGIWFCNSIFNILHFEIIPKCVLLLVMSHHVCISRSQRWVAAHHPYPREEDEEQPGAHWRGRTWKSWPSFSLKWQVWYEKKQMPIIAAFSIFSFPWFWKFQSLKFTDLRKMFFVPRLELARPPLHWVLHNSLLRARYHWTYRCGNIPNMAKFCGVVQHRKKICISKIPVKFLFQNLLDFFWWSG